MTTIPFVAPKFDANAFNCPHCHAYANQGWGQILRFIGSSNQGPIPNAKMATCAHCGNFSIWLTNSMVYPLVNTSPSPNPDMPDKIKKDYEEARNILSLSPKGAAALLRLCIQKLCIELGEQGNNINKDIAALVSKGLPEKIQQALDIVRVVGNNAVHPGQIDLDDDLSIANSLFGLVNIITDVMITQPNHVNNLYNTVLPESQREAIKKRDEP